MCISTNESEMSSTNIYVGEALKDEKTVHVLAYQNSAFSIGPNAMILPFPTDVIMSENNIIKTKDFPNFLKHISEASQHFTREERRSFAPGPAASSDALAKVFDVGSYTVILSTRVSQIPEALKRVPASKRPNISTKFLIEYSKLYPKQPVAVCCWAGNVKAEPILWWYEPRDPSVLFIPTMDAHDGNAPDIDAVVTTDHIISVGSADRSMKYGSLIYYDNLVPPEVKSLLPKYVFGTKLPPSLQNGDCFVKTADIPLFSGPILIRGTDEHIIYKTNMNGWF